MRKTNPILALLFLTASATTVQAAVGAAESLKIKADFKEISAWAKETLAPRMGDREVGDLLPQSGLTLYLTPNRKVKIPGEAPVTGSDPLQDPHKRGILTKPWRDYYFYPNNLPYLEDHILLISKDGLKGTQAILDEDKSTLGDVLDLQSVFPDYTATFNHLAGNSIQHFHVHFSPQPLPIEAVLASDPITTPDTVFDVPNTEVQHQMFDDLACQRGFELSGKKEDLLPVLFDFVSTLTHCMGFYYNLILLPMEGENHRALIFVRWKPEDRKVTPADLPYKVDPGSLELGGLMMVATPVSTVKGQASPNPYLDLELFDAKLRETCDVTILPPADVGRFLELNGCSAELS